MNEAIKILNAENTVVHTTSCPIRSASAPISCDIGTLETATGVQKHATKLANWAPLNLLNKIAIESPITGTITQRLRVPSMMCFLRWGIADNSNLAPKTISERGVATLERF